MAEDMLSALERNCREAGIRLLDLDSGVAGHRPRHRPGAGADAAGHDDRLRRQPHLDARRVRRRRVRHRHVAGARRARVAVPGDGAAEGPAHRGQRARSRAGVYAKDVILEIIRRLGVKGGVGYAYEYAGDTIERMSMDERMTICNMSIEGGARVGYVNPDQTTFDYLRGRPFAPQGDAFEQAVRVVAQHGVRSPTRATTTRSTIDAAAIRPTVTWGINPGQSVYVDETLPQPATSGEPIGRAASPKRSSSWASTAGEPIKGTRSTSRSSARAPTRGSPICARPRGSSRAITSRRTSRRSSCRDRRRSASRPSAKASTASSPTPASSGAAPAARCAWR